MEGGREQERAGEQASREAAGEGRGQEIQGTVRDQLVKAIGGDVARARPRTDHDGV